jgi:LAO/AO transport system kinase
MSDVEDLVIKMVSGDSQSLARLISKVESRDKDLAEIMKLIYPKTGEAQVIGVTGPLGAGRSTLVDQMTALYRAQGKRVATAATKEAVLVLDAAGFDVILVETAGVGQTELDVLRLAQTVAVMRECGDSILVSLADQDEKIWTEVNELVACIEKHQIFLKTSGKLQTKKIEFLKNEVANILSERLSLSLKHQFETSSGQDLIEKLSRLELDPYQVADLFSGL